MLGIILVLLLITYYIKAMIDVFVLMSLYNNLLISEYRVACFLVSLVTYGIRVMSDLFILVTLVICYF